MKFIKKPIVIDAWLITQEFIDSLSNEKEQNNVYPQKDYLMIHTLEGDMRGDIGNYLIKGVNGEFYPCRADIFEKTYQQGEVGSISDGYHTFNELYDHRITLFIALCLMTVRYGEDQESEPSPTGDYLVPCVWRSKCHSDGELCFGSGWFVLGIGKAKGEQITYHIPIERWEETNFAQTLERAPEWDGHTPADVLERLKKL